MLRLQPAQLVAVSFLLVILIGGAALSLPQSSSQGHSLSLIDAFFTATSATCVTGLVVKDIGKDFSAVGQMVILFLIQIGGLGIMTLSTFFAIIIGRRFTLRENVVMKGALDRYSAEGLKSLVVYILFITFVIEIIGALCLYSRFGNAYYSIFHSISAFCNAGFSLYPNNMENFRSDTVVNMTMMALVIVGGIGFVVVVDVGRFFRNFFMRIFFRKKQQGMNLFSKVSLQAKIVVGISLVLILLGASVFLLLENGKMLYGLGIKDKLLISFFQAVAPRTAGFNTVAIGNLASPTLFFMMILMFIGASSGSTGGGIKTNTLAVLIGGAWSMVKNKDNVSLFKRTVPKVIFRKCVMIAGLAGAWLVVFTMLLSFVEAGKEAMPNYFLRILFEVTSAFGTVGLSTGITPILSSFGKFILMLTMLVGRIGPLTLALAISVKEDKFLYKYPEEKIMVG
ncbi:MAG: Trk family potassium uptake protein [Candidatus Omnitrophica bacterium CG_4_9_14_0_2_um_filter_42_8]|nr:MAG: Trk family potassium uptake protein [Candidatus Omnitrophica bacterium CG22_combo_CG10-13_8_21_14_all_43_16]PJC49074.1 MAG: Trk family potassium uptake protein [Candidatus Omnitrophica bacterium CG_4_9_14_0_2_um_filter_42_8]